MEKMVTKKVKAVAMSSFFDDPEELTAVYDWLGTSAESYLIVGYPGSGKTTLTLDFPGLYMLNADNKSAGVSDEVKKRTKTFKHGDQVYEIIMGILRTIGANYEEAINAGIKTIVLDTITGFCSYMEAEILNDSVLNFKGTEALQIQHYGIIQNRIAEIVRVAKEVGVNLVVVAHPDEIVNEDGDIILHPSITGKKGEVKLPGMFDHVVFMSYDETKGFVAQLKPTEKFKHAKLSMESKEAYNAAPKLLKDVSYKRLRGVIDGKLSMPKKKEEK